MSRFKESMEWIFKIISVPYFVLAIIFLFHGETLEAKLLNFLIFLIIYCFIFSLFYAILINYKEWKKAIFFVTFCFTIFLPNAKGIVNLVTFVVSSEILELKYDFENNGRFKESRQITYDNGCILEKLQNGHYRIILPNNISEVKLFYTSYDDNGKHIGRMTWLEDVDFYFKGRYIESKHELNESFNKGKGRHLIRYKYKTNLIEILKNPVKFFENYLK